MSAHATFNVGNQDHCVIEQAADLYLGADVTSTATCHHDEDVANQIRYQSYAGIKTQCDACRRSLDLGSRKAFGDPEASDVVPLPFLLMPWDRI